MTDISAHTTTICPECGRNAADRSLPNPASLFHWRRVIPWLVVALAAAGLATWIYLGRQTHRMGSGTFMPVMVEPPLTLADVQQIAEGEGSDGQLLVSLREAVKIRSRFLLPGGLGLDVGFATPEGKRCRDTVVGWPVGWYSRNEWRRYENAARRTGFRPAQTDSRAEPLGQFQLPDDFDAIPRRPRWDWTWHSVSWQPPPEETGGVYTTATFEFAAFAPVIALAVAAWTCAAGVVWLVNLFRSRDHRIRGRRFKWGMVALSLIVVIVLGFAMRTTADRCVVRVKTVPWPATGAGPRPPGSTHYIRAGFARLGLTSHLDQYHGADGEPRLARYILAAITQPPPAGPMIPRLPAETSTERPLPENPHEIFLCAALDPESHLSNASVTVYGTMFSICSEQYTRRADFGEPISMAFQRGTQFHLDHGQLTILQSSGDPAKPTRRIAIDLTMAGAMVIALWLAWLLAALGCRGLHRLIAKRRCRRQQCAGCGYPLAIAPAGASR